MESTFPTQAKSSRDKHVEGPVAKSIEEQTAKLPSDLFLWVAGSSILASLVFKSMGKNGTANFIGQWVPTILVLGLYNKVVKVAGSDQQSAA